MRAKLSLLHARARDRPRGYAESFLAVGRTEGDEIIIDDAEFAKLKERWTGVLLGNRIHQWILPLARWLDARFGTKLSSCAACSRRVAFLNRLHLAFSRLTRWPRP